MADILKLKKKAADFEAKKQMDRALATYREMIEVYESGEEDPIDIPLYNRVGDLLQKAGNLPEAVAVWERAVDHYADGGFYNPAIALCNKILRQSPGRAVVYYKLGKISAEKGFKTDARQNFLEYAGRMQKSGNLDEAFRALKEFADLVPDQDDVRVMLAEQLLKAGRKDDSIEQLQVLHALLASDGREEDAAEIAERIRAIDPAIEPRAGEGGGSSRGGDLVFLDLDPSPRRGSRSTKTPAAEVRRATKAIEGLEVIEFGVEAPKAPAPSAASPAPAPRAAPPAPTIEPPTVPSAPAAGGVLDDLLIEPTSIAGEAAPPASGTVLGLEPTMIDLEPTMIDLEPTAASAPVAPPAPPPVVEERGPETMFIDIETSDFGSFGEVAPFGDPTSASTDFDLLEIESSEGVHSLPMDEPDSEPLNEPALGTSFESIEFEPAKPTPPDPALAAAAAAFEMPVAESKEGEEGPSARATSAVLAHSVDALRARVGAMPEDPGLRRQLAEALLDDGQRDEGIAELERALAGYEKGDDLDTAASIAEEIVRLAPRVIRYHQKRVEFAFRANDRRRLAEAYVELADALMHDGQAPKARVVYQRVLDIAPDDLRAQAALETIADVPVPEPTPAPRRSQSAVKPAAPAAKPKPKAPKEEDEYVSLGDWLRDDALPKNTRMIVEEKEPTGDEQADFNDMLRKFKQGIADNVEEEDHEAHYDLGIAYKEMGLLDEAISEFQIALRGTAERARTFEALGHCFVEKGQLPVAATILQRALGEPGLGDEALIGVLYLLGAISEELQLYPDARRYYQRVFAVDIQFRDVGERLNTVEQRLK